MSFEEDEKALLVQCVPRINEALKLLAERGLFQDDIIAILERRLNKGETYRGRKISASTIERVLREIKKLDFDVRGAIE